MRGRCYALTREHVPSPRNNGRGNKHGSGWGHNSVRAILVNEKYVGRWRWNASKWVRVPGKKARRQLARPESEHVVREYPELAIIDSGTWARVQARIGRQSEGNRETLRKGQRPYLLSGLLRCGVCGGPMSVSGQRVKNGVRYAQFGCTAHSSRGGAVCANTNTISEKRITDALLETLRETFTASSLANVFATHFGERIAERAKQDTSALERQLRAAETRVTNATRLMVEAPDDLDLRRQRQADQAEVRRLQAEIAAHAAAESAVRPSPKAIAKAASKMLSAIANDAPERGREVLAKLITPLTLTPKTEGPEHLFEVSGSVDLLVTAAVTASGSSGGRI